MMDSNTLKNQVSETAYSWLSSKASLTKRLREFTCGKISHHLFYDNWGTAPGIACQALKIQPSCQAWIRKMEWRFNHESWVACIVIIPKTSITSQTQKLMHIGKNSIGDILFQDSEMQRSDFEFSKKQDTENIILWERYSIFYYYQQPLLILELFFPEFFCAIEA